MSDPRPWSIPVPLRPSRFRSLHAEHAELNVETDLAAIGAFDGRGARDSAWIGHADLQVGGLEQRRLGSGRSCTFRGKYLKGIGRTQLAGNWCDPADVYHHSGHLLPSGGLREYVVSRWLAARGLGHTIVPCEGLLLAEQDPQLADFHARAFPDLVARGGEPRPVDRHLQALTVKPGGFSRFSNYSWLLNQWHSPRMLTSFCNLLAADLGLDGSADPDDLARGLDAAVQRGMGHFATYLRAGVFWGSFYNNFTLDGRILDLEVPTIFGRPYTGLYVEQLPGGERSRPFYIVPGCETFVYLDEARRFVLHAQHALRFMLAYGVTVQPVVLEFVRELVAAFDRVFAPDHVIHDRGAARAHVSRLLTAVFEPGAAAARLDELVARSQAWILDTSGVPFEITGDWEELPFAAAPRETMLRQVFYWPRWLPTPSFESGSEINELLEELDSQRDIASIFALVRGLASA